MNAGVTTRRRQKRSALTRERLLETAAEVFVEYGYERAATADIAQRASVSTGAIYSNFRGKPELLLEVMRSRFEAEVEKVKAEVRRRQNEPIHPLVAVAATRMEDSRPTTRALLLEAISIARRDPTVREVLREIVLDFYRFMESQVRRAQERGRIDKDLDAATVAWFYLLPAATDSFAQALEIEFPPLDSWLALLDRLAGALSAGASLSNPTAASAPGGSGSGQSS